MVNAATRGEGANVVDQPNHPSDESKPNGDPTGDGGRSSHFETADSSTPSSANASEEVPDRIGPYRPIARLGTGGMGVVYLADQESPIRRQVALKIVRHGLQSEDVIARFETERQTLALMDHPGIAKVFDAGTTPDGRPYFVMEYVKGVPINEHCDRNRLNVAERLRLMIDVCDAVQHAHQKGVIHRDLKPSNILVSYQDDVARPKVIDFGVAKATNHRLSEKAYFTEFGQLIGTPEYMSPEQAEMTSQDIDTRSDIYSLGVVLYELLIGQLPFDSKTLRAAGYAEIQRIIREVDPPRPSTKLTTEIGQSREMMASAARNRATGALELARELRGDLDWVVMKAIEKDRTRRYHAVSDFASDLEAYLHHDPVKARPPSASYRTRKFVRRHRTLVASAATVAVAIVVGAVGMAWQARIASIQRDRAELRLAEGRDLANALLGDVQTAVTNLEGSTKARELLTDAALTYLNSLDAAALDTKELRESAANAYERLGDVMGATFVGNLGETASAREAFDRAIEIRRANVKESPNDLTQLQLLARTQSKLAGMLRRTGDTAEAIALSEEALTWRRQLAAAAPKDIAAQRDLATAIQTIGDMHKRQHEFDQADVYYTEALTIRRDLGRRQPNDLAVQREISSAAMRLGNLAMDRGNPVKALEFNRECVNVREALAKRDATDSGAQRDLMWGLYFLSSPLAALDRFDEAVDRLRRAKTIAERRREVDPLNAEAQRDWMLVSSQLAAIAMSVDAQAAAQTFDELAAYAKSLKDADPDNATLAIEYGVAQRNAGMAHAAASDYSAANRAYMQAVAVLQVEADRDPDNANVTHDVAQALTGQGVTQMELDDSFGAAASLQAAINAYESLGADSSEDARVRRGYAEALAALAGARAELGSATEAGDMLGRARDVLGSLPEDETTSQIRRRIESVRLLLAEGS